MEWHDLEKMTVVKLREEAHEKGIEGVHGKHKAQLVRELAAALGVERPQEALPEEVVHTKSELKGQIHELKAKRNELIAAHDHKGLTEVRRKVHGLKRKIRKMHLRTARQAS